MVKIVFILLIGVAAALAAPTIDADERILGGRPAANGQFPYQISLRVQGSHSCGGSIIDATTILCAAHCVVGASPIGMTVVVGTNKLHQGGVSYPVQKLIAHTEYDGRIFANDIALIKVAIPIQFNANVQPIALETNETPDNHIAILSGWGLTSYPGNIPEDLLYIGLRTLNIQTCAYELQPSNIFNSQICTYNGVGQGSCQGDSGGPLINSETGRQIGIVSWGRPCAIGKPDVFTKVAWYINWINANK